MKEIISKIKGIVCRISQEIRGENKIEIFCYGNNKCDTCCGLEACECNNKLITKDKRLWKEEY